MAIQKGRLIGRGRTAEVFEWGDTQVLKLFHDWCTPAMVEREARTTVAVHEIGLPAPAVERTLEVDGRLGIVFERIYGPPMGDVLKKEPWRLFRLARVMADLHAMMHSFELPALPSRRERLEEAIRSVALLPDNNKEAVLKSLKQLPDGSAVCHGDFYVDNVVMSPRGPIITDWFGAARGDPLADVARTWLLNRLAYLRAGLPERWVINVMRLLFHRSYLKRYFGLRGGSPDRVIPWLLPVVAARLAENVPGEAERFVPLVDKLLLHNA